MRPRENPSSMHRFTVREHPYIMSCFEGRGGVWRSVTEYYENSDKNMTGGWGS